MNRKYWYDDKLNDIMRGEVVLGEGEECGAMAVLEHGYADIEINIFGVMGEQSEKVEPYIEYCVCVHHSDDPYDWETDGFMDDVAKNSDEVKCAVDWNADDWAEQLEKDMLCKLNLYCERMRYDLTKPIVYSA